MQRMNLYKWLVLIWCAQQSWCLPACERPTFVAASLATLQNSGVKIHSTQRQHPADEALCVYAASWIDPTDPSSIGFYVATYFKQNAQKNAELQSSIANEQLWFDPTIEILPTKFDIHPTAKAFAVAITWQFLAGTYSQTTSQLQLLTLKDDSQLQRVLSLPVQEIFQYRNCPELCETGAQGQICKVVCEGEDSQTVRELVVGKGQQQGYRDLWVTTTKSRVDAKQWTEQYKQRYFWHGADYRKE